MRRDPALALPFPRRACRSRGGRPTGGYSLVEVLIAVTLATLLLAVAWRVLRAGLDSSLHGIQQVDLTLEARRVIQQIHQDLKMSCFERGPAGFAQEFARLVQVRPGSGPNPLEGMTWSFLRFPHEGEVADVCSTGTRAGPAPRFAVRVTYRLQADAARRSPFWQLVRVEEPPAGLPGGRTRTQVLSSQVNYLAIRPVELGTEATGRLACFHVTLQVGRPVAGAGSGSDAGRGSQIVDAFDVVYSECFNAIRNHPGMNFGWYAPIVGPPF